MVDLASQLEQVPARAPRRVVRVRCTLDFGVKGTVHGFTHDMGSTGLAVELSAASLVGPAPAEGDELGVSIMLPGEPAEVRARAVIVWTTPSAEGANVLRIGARYVEPSRGAVVALTNFVASFRFSVLVVATEPESREEITRVLGSDFLLFTRDSMSEALALLRTEHVAALILTTSVLEPNPLEVLATLQREGLGRNIPCIVVGRPQQGSDESMIASGKVFQIVEAPVEPFILKQVTLRAVETYQLAVENERLHHELERVIVRLRGENAQLRKRVAAPGGDGLIGNSDSLRKVLEMLPSVQVSPVPVYVHGESGTGKELLARAIHFGGPRANKPFVAHNCAATTPSLLESILFGHKRGAFTGAERDHPGLFEQADGGSLFLDEVADLPPAVQSALLRVAQDGVVVPVGGTTPRSVDVRLISASNRDLHDAVEAGRFRADLFYRLVVVQIDLPPLRERRDDIPILVQHFLQIASAKHATAPCDVTPAAMSSLETYDWPGNVRELANEIERAVVLGRGATIDIGHLSLRVTAGARPPTPGKAGAVASYGIAPGTPLDDALASVERQLIIDALEHSQGNQSAASRRLGIQRATLRYRMAKYGIDSRDDDKKPS